MNMPEGFKPIKEAIREMEQMIDDKEWNGEKVDELDYYHLELLRHQDYLGELYVPNF